MVPSMPRVIVSTVGTSMLTNGAPQELRGLLIRTANTPEARLTDEDRTDIERRADEVGRLIAGASPEQAQRQSAELNGVVRLGLSGRDVHYLIATDTLQGRLCAKIAAEWIQTAGATAIPQPISGLSTADTESFSDGINTLLEWCDATLPECRAQNRRVVFNLVGGFKAMQAYLQALGMFYADEIVYIFESGSDLIRIPRLPVKWDHEGLSEHAAVMARLAHGAKDITPAMVAGVPEAYLEIVDCGGQQLVGLSTWGRAAWLSDRQDILSSDLIEFPGVMYEDTYRRDYARLQDREVRWRFQDTVAEVSVLLENGGLPALTGGSIRYDKLQNHPGIDHFRVSLDLRISCRVEGSCLILRKCGAHDYVINNP